jgi:putative transposase
MKGLRMTVVYTSVSTKVCSRALAIAAVGFCYLVGWWASLRMGCLIGWHWLLEYCWRGTRKFYRRAAASSSVASFGAADVDFALKQVTSPRAHHKAKPDWVKAELLRLMVFMPRASVRLLAMAFNRLHFAGTGVSVGRSFVYAFRLRCRYEVAVAQRALKSRPPIDYAKNHTWGLDLTGKQMVTDSGTGIVVTTNPYILGLIDHGSRLLLALTPLRSKHSWRLAWCVALLVARYGKPKFIKTDNDAVFTSKLFKACLATLGVAHRRTAVMSPWQNGRIERLFGTLKQSLDEMTVPSFAALGSLMGTFRYFYNDVRPHQALGGLTPAEAWAGVSWQDVCEKRCKTIVPFSAWDGLLVGFVTNR